MTMSVYGGKVLSATCYDRLNASNDLGYHTSDYGKKSPAVVQIGPRASLGLDVSSPAEQAVIVIMRERGSGGKFLGNNTL